MSRHGSTIELAINGAHGFYQHREQAEADLMYAGQYWTTAATFLEAVIGQSIDAGIPAWRIHELTGVPLAQIEEIASERAGQPCRS